MKYAREFKEHLLTEGFPTHWVESAISYGRLKKCIKRVQNELAALGLDVETLHRLLKSDEIQKRQSAADEGSGTHEATVTLASGPVGAGVDKPFRYRLVGSNVHSGSVQPKLLFVVDAVTGEPLDATLSPETRDYLQQLAVNDRMGKVHITEEQEESLRTTKADNDVHLERVPSNATDACDDCADSTSKRKYIAVPLSSDSEFFGLLEREVSGLAALQEAEKKKLTAEIEDLGKAVSKITRPRDSNSRTDLTRWRRIFEIYLESNIFFATNEQDHGVHNRAKAQKQWEFFLGEVQKAGLADHFRRKENIAAVQKFMTINVELLQSLRFQEINQIAMNKILKKFDKRTALGAKQSFPALLPSSIVGTDFSRALAASVSTNIISVIPQLDDYLCPICFQIAYRPIRLRCSHVFCIRCLIIMQRTRKNNCALCREPTVLEADNTNLDVTMQTFLKKWFKDEAKAKQKANERAAFEDEFPGVNSGDGCVVM